MNMNKLITFSEESFLEFFEKKFGDYFTTINEYRDKFQELLPDETMKKLDRLFTNTEDSLESSCFHYFMFNELHRIYSEVFEEDKSKAEESKLDVIIDIELGSFLLNLRGSLDPLAKSITLITTGDFNEKEGLGKLRKGINDLKIKDEFKEYSQLEMDKWIFEPQKTQDYYEKELEKYSRMDKEYEDIMNILFEPKLNSLRKHLAHGRRIMTFHTISEPIVPKGGKSSWHHSIPDKPQLKEGDRYTTIKTIDYMGGVFRRTLDFQLTYRKYLLEELRLVHQKIGKNSDN